MTGSAVKIDKETIKRAASGRWPEIISAICGIASESLDSRHHPCPKCGGTDRFRAFDDFAETGGTHCNQCGDKSGNGGANPDGFSTLAWFNGWDFKEALHQTARHLGINNPPQRQSRVSEDIIDRVCLAKQMPKDAFESFGVKPARRSKQDVARVDVYNSDGEIHSHFDLSTRGKGLWKAGKGNSGLFFPGRLPEPGETWHLVEGVKDAAALVGLGFNACGLPGTSLPKQFALLFRDVHCNLVPDLDEPSFAGVDKTASRLYRNVSSIVVTRLPGEIGSKADVRDVLRLQGESVLKKAMQSASPWEPVGEVPDEKSPYLMTEQGCFLSRYDSSSDSYVQVQIANFSAEIVSQVVVDDGTEDFRCEFRIKANVYGRSREFTVDSEQFAKMDWHFKHLGPLASITPGYKDHVRHAIQTISKCDKREVVYRHLGWRRIDDRWVFLHRDGFIDADSVGACPEWPGYSVSLEQQLKCFCFEFVPTGDELTNAVQASMTMVDVAARYVGFVLLAATYRAVLGCCNFSVWMHGQTGCGKTELSALAQRHFGREMDAKTLPLSWVDTANSMEVVAFAAKDCLTVADDYNGQVPLKAVDRFIRAQGNSAGRTRLTRDGQVIAGKYPRGLAFCTAEDVPMEHSGVARCVLAELPGQGAEGCTDWEKLTIAQQMASEGQFEIAMAGFIRWVASQYDVITKRLADRSSILRNQLARDSSHKRTPDSIASLVAGLELFVDFAVDCGALSQEQAAVFLDEGRESLIWIADQQGEFHRSADPVERFVDLLQTAIDSGEAYITDMDGSLPFDSNTFTGHRNMGWEFDVVQNQWVHRGRHIGWLKVADNELYLSPGQTDTAIRQIGERAKYPLAIGRDTLWRRLKEAGRLVRWDDDRCTTKVTVESKRARVLVLCSYLVAEKPGRSGHKTGYAPVAPVKPALGSKGTPENGRFHAEGEKAGDPGARSSSRSGQQTRIPVPDQSGRPDGLSDCDHEWSDEPTVGGRIRTTCRHCGKFRGYRAAGKTNNSGVAF